jgi:predicted metalloprotease
MFESVYAGRFAVVFGVICLTGALGWSLDVDSRPLIGWYGLERSLKEPGLPKESRIGAPSDPVGSFVAGVLGSTEEVWDAIFNASGQQYRYPTLVLYGQSTQAGCGLAQSIMGPFYCPYDQKVYLDTSFFREIELEYHACDEAGSACQFADAYVIAHEIGHHVQNLLGILPKVRQLQREASTLAEKNHLQVLLELQADCLAGVWGHQVKEKLKISATDLLAVIRTLEALGNDTLQKAASARVVPDSFTHGTAEQRHHWFDVGFTTGTVASCNTFAPAKLRPDG